VRVDKGLVRFDTDSGRYEAIPAGNRPWGYAAGAGSVRVGSESPGSVQRIDPQTNRLTRTTEITSPVHDKGPVGVVYLKGDVWVSVE
jgi:hypothetical protein